MISKVLSQIATSPYVWVVGMGETGMGGSVMGIFSSLQKARAHVHREYPEFHLDPVQPEHHISYHWGTDWIKIRAHQVL